MMDWENGSHTCGIEVLTAEIGEWIGMELGMEGESTGNTDQQST